MRGIAHSVWYLDASMNDEASRDANSDIDATNCENNYVNERDVTDRKVYVEYTTHFCQILSALGIEGT